MPYIRYSQRDDIVSDHLRLGGYVEDRKTYKRKQAVDVAELEGDYASGRADWGEGGRSSGDLRVHEMGEIEERGEEAGDAVDWG